MQRALPTVVSSDRVTRDYARLVPLAISLAQSPYTGEPCPFDGDGLADIRFTPRLRESGRKNRLDSLACFCSPI